MRSRSPPCSVQALVRLHHGAQADCFDSANQRPQTPAPLWLSSHRDEELIRSALFHPRILLLIHSVRRQKPTRLPWIDHHSLHDAWAQFLQQWLSVDPRRHMLPVQLARLCAVVLSCSLASEKYEIAFSQ